ncbi:YhdP family protein [Variovorax sp. PAMC26660]|uniref:YhdP family protein n=1 Tax=Variovorax sp. PAMC26660 TaxID=2762322 RepID=UPI00164ED0B3|nr:YhdP family protein [Variovorax sp. PAMC26660]QNK70134.1 TIGR02099 family protein [Variovorax sp. PAMC26660]
MNDTASTPSRLLKITAVTARWLLGLLIAAWLLLALSVVVLHAWIVPRIGDFRGALEAQASKAIGVPVRIGSITARSEGLFPAFELRDVVLQDADNREALRLVRVVASVSPRSLWRLNFEQLYIEGPQVDVRRDAQGKLHVAGLHMSTETTGETRAADWFFAQRELVIEGGTVRWTDEQRRAEPLLLTDVRFVARNTGLRHGLRLDATPPAGWGERFTLRGQFRQPFLSMRSGRWQTWDGQLYADLPYIDVTRLGQYVALDARIREGNGALRVWADVDDGQIVGGAADLGLDQVDVSLDKGLQPLVLRAVTGRLAGHRSEETLEFSTTALQFETSDGMRWPGGNLWLQHTPAKGRTPEHGAVRADRLDLAALALIADRLPLGEATHKVLGAYAPRGLVEHIDVSWQGALGAPDRYQAKGRVSGLRVASQPGAADTAAGPPPASTTATTPVAAANNATPAHPKVHPGTPGLSGATLDFDATHAGGTATLAIAQGTLEFPGVFEDPIIPIDRLSTQLQWKLDNGNAQLQVSKLRFANVDAEGDAEASWRTSDPATSSGKGHYPGVLDLQGKLTRADGTRVFRYLPLDIPQHTRDYVRDAVTKGTASSVDFRVRGDLHDMPFLDPKLGDFRIAAKVADVNYAYAPPHVPPAPARNGMPPPVWPPLTGLSGELVFERDSMLVRNARGRLAGANGVEVTKAEAQIPELSHHAPQLRVDAQAKGPLAEVLRAGAPLAGETGEIMLRARATGSADYKLHLELPLAAMDNAKVQASVTLADNELQVVPEAPSLTQAKGTLNFTETGFSLAGVQARLLGGDIRIEGKGRFSGPNREVALKAQGTATADGLRGAREIEWLSRLAGKASGSTPFAATFSVRDGAPEFSLTSSLQGMALQLPPPLVKTAEEQMPLRIEKKVTARETRQGASVATQDQLTLDLGRVGAIQYMRDISGTEARVLRGSIGFGLTAGETASLPDKGVFANVNIVKLDISAWQALLGSAVSNASESAGSTERPDDPALAYLPTRIAVRAQQLGVAGRTLHNVVLGGTRDGALWRANIDATELSGYAEYRHTQAGRLYARLARLKIAPSEATQVETLLDEQPGALPALDIVIDDFELLGKRLGRAEIDAVNRGGAGREWALNKLGFTMPEASFSAKGTWAAIPGAAVGQRRTAMTFKLDIADAGELLGRFGMPGVLRRGKGRLEGDVNWRGSPFSLDYPSLSGQLQVDVESGQFLKADPGLAKLLGVLSLQALPRRLTLDFRDVFSQGFAFDFIRGDAKINKGIASTNNLQMKGVNAAALMDGSADIVRETQNLRVVVVPEINAGTAALVATAINPAIGLGTFLAQWVLSKPLSAAATQEFHVEGTWADPKIAKVPRTLQLLPQSIPTLPGLPALPGLPGSSTADESKKTETTP